MYLVHFSLHKERISLGSCLCDSFSDFFVFGNVKLSRDKSKIFFSIIII